MYFYPYKGKNRYMALVKSNRRMIPRQSVIAFVGDCVMPAPGKTVGVCGLYSAYLKHADRFGIRITRERFCRILDRQGYRRCHGLYGGVYEDITYA